MYFRYNIKNLAIGTTTVMSAPKQNRHFKHFRILRRDFLPTSFHRRASFSRATTSTSSRRHQRQRRRRRRRRCRRMPRCRTPSKCRRRNSLRPPGKDQSGTVEEVSAALSSVMHCKFKPPPKMDCFRIFEYSNPSSLDLIGMWSCCLSRKCFGARPPLGFCVSSSHIGFIAPCIII